VTQATDREADYPSARSFPWRPLLRGDATEPVLAVVDDIARAVAPLMRNEEADPSLAAGAAGGAFLFSALERAGRTHGGLPTSRALLAHAARSANRGPLPPSLWQGTGGVAYALSQLAGCRPEPTLLARFADWTSGVPDSQYDLISGLTGMGVLALELLPDPAAAELLKVVVLRLSASAERGELGITWASSEHLPRTARYDLGTAHGVPGVIGLLAGALRTPSPPAHTRELLEGAVRWTLAQRLEPGAPSALPYSAPGPHAPTPARLAWCYGDAGAAIPLLLAAEALEDEHLREAAHDLARGAAMRRPETAGVVDAGICHGAAGLAHLFGRMWQLTGDDAFAAAGRYWLDRTIELRRPELPVAGFPRLMPERERGPLLPRAESGLLAGAVGVGLMLLAACHDDEPSWDRALLASRLGH
jgi:lantibiotic biosynthesis protein